MRVSLSVPLLVFGLLLSGSALAHASTGTYINSDGNTIQSPSFTRPASATALCKDGTWSSSRHRRGTCNGHRGVKKWL